MGTSIHNRPTSTGDIGTAGAAGATGDLAVVAAASPEASAAENWQEALDDTAAPSEGTALFKAAVCAIDAQKAAELGIRAPD